MKTIGFIGCGNMAQPIIRNVAEKNVFNKNDIYVYDIDREKLSSFCKKTEINVAESEAQIASECDVVVLCTKPQVFPELLPAIAGQLKENNPLVVSIAAGKTTDYISSVLDYDAPVARIFPNLNAQVGEAISAYTGNKFVNEEQLATVGEICSSFGEAKYMDESLFSVFGVLGGCVPAYAFMFIGALAKAGVADIGADVIDLSVNRERFSCDKIYIWGVFLGAGINKCGSVGEKKRKNLCGHIKCTVDAAGLNTDEGVFDYFAVNSDVCSVKGEFRAIDGGTEFVGFLIPKVFHVEVIQKCRKREQLVGEICGGRKQQRVVG